MMAQILALVFTLEICYSNLECRKYNLFVAAAEIDHFLLSWQTLNTFLASTFFKEAQFKQLNSNLFFSLGVVYKIRYSSLFLC